MTDQDKKSVTELLSLCVSCGTLSSISKLRKTNRDNGFPDA